MCSQAGEVVVVRRVRQLVVVLLRVASRLNARATHDCLRAVRGGLGVHELLHKHLECGTGVARGAARAHAVRHVQSGDSYHVGADANHPEELARAGQIGRVPRALREAGWARDGGRDLRHDAVHALADQNESRQPLLQCTLWVIRPVCWQVDATIYRAAVAPLLSSAGIDMLPEDVDAMDGFGRKELADKMVKKRTVTGGMVKEAAEVAGVPQGTSSKEAQLVWLLANWPAPAPVPVVQPIVQPAAEPAAAEE
jgi:hypothetical protein